MTPALDKLPRVLAGWTFEGPMGLEEHESIHGRLPGSDEPPGPEHSLIAELEHAGLCGLGGASFPTAVKLRAVASQRARPIVVVNGAEGEPLSRKDRLLLSQLPHLVLDGSIAVARALGSREVVIGLEYGSGSVARELRRALSERRELSRRGLSIEVVAVPDGFVVGQETALIDALDGGAGKPTLVPPYPFERGLRRRPTLVSNAETLAQIALIARHGATWFRGLGTPTQPGSRLVTVSGAVARPGVLEVAGGTPVKVLLGAAGGTTEPLQGLLLGGFGGTWVGPEGLGLSLDEGALREHGLTLGAGILFALPESACPVSEVARVARWQADESSGQCGPCVFGLDAIAGALEELCYEGDRSGAFAHLERWCGLVTRRGACAHPDGAARFVRTALRTFHPTFEDHARHGGCDACRQPPLMPLARPRARAAA